MEAAPGLMMIRVRLLQQPQSGLAQTKHGDRNEWVNAVLV